MRAMNTRLNKIALGTLCVLLWATRSHAGESMNPANANDDKSPASNLAVALPTGVAAVWDLGRAYRETTPTRERICLNGLWRWQPAEPDSERVPATNWGYFKVPGC